MPVVSLASGAVLRSLGLPVEFIPVHIEGFGAYEIMNLLQCVELLDRLATEILYWREEDGLPEKVGQIFGIFKPTLKRSAIEGTSMFRLFDWEQDIIVTERVKHAFEANGMTGVLFEELTVTDNE